MRLQNNTLPKLWQSVFDDGVDDSQAVTVLPEGLLPATYSDKDFDASVQSTQYLPRLQLMTSNSEKCKSGEFTVNNYALVEGQKFIDLGNPVDVLVISWRPKALKITDEEIITVHDPSDPQFSAISAEAFTKDSGCMFGPEFLVYIPSHGFATFFMGSVSARNEAASVKKRLQQVVTLKHQMISGKKYTWAAPECFDCSTEISLPDQEAIVAEHEKFINPPKNEVESVSANEKEASARER